MKLYRNYDGNDSTFGDISLSAAVPDPDNVAAFAAERSEDGALTVIVLNKYLADFTPVTLQLHNFAHASTVQCWQLTSSNAITRLQDLTFYGDRVGVSLPPQSITLFIFPRGTAATKPLGKARAGKAPTEMVRRRGAGCRPLH